MKHLLQKFSIETRKTTMSQKDLIVLALDDYDAQNCAVTCGSFTNADEVKEAFNSLPIVAKDMGDYIWREVKMLVTIDKDDIDIYEIYDVEVAMTEEERMKQ